MKKQSRRMMILCALLLTLLFSVSAFAEETGIKVTGQEQSENSIKFTVTAPSGTLYAACDDMSG